MPRWSREFNYVHSWESTVVRVAYASHGNDIGRDLAMEAIGCLILKIGDQGFTFNLKVGTDTLN